MNPGKLLSTKYLLHRTDHIGWISYGGAWFESQQGNRLSWL